MFLLTSTSKSGILEDPKRKITPMARFRATIVYTFDTEYEVEAGSYEEAEARALEEATEWKSEMADIITLQVRSGKNMLSE